MFTGHFIVGQLKFRNRNPGSKIRVEAAKAEDSDRSKMKNRRLLPSYCETTFFCVIHIKVND